MYVGCVVSSSSTQTSLQEDAVKVVRSGIQAQTVGETCCFKNTPGVDSRGGEQEAAQAAVGVALALALRAAVGKRLDDLHKGLWENSCLVIDRSL